MKKPLLSLSLRFSPSLLLSLSLSSSFFFPPDKELCRGLQHQQHPAPRRGKPGFSHLFVSPPHSFPLLSHLVRRLRFLVEGNAVPARNWHTHPAKHRGNLPMEPHVQNHLSAPFGKHAGGDVGRRSLTKLADKPFGRNPLRDHVRDGAINGPDCTRVVFFRVTVHRVDKRRGELVREICLSFWVFEFLSFFPFREKKTQKEKLKGKNSPRPSGRLASSDSAET